jgi:undecaprenyl-diphosphatase
MLLFLLLTLAAALQLTRGPDLAVLRVGTVLRGAPYSQLRQSDGHAIQVHPVGRLSGFTELLGLVGTPVVAGLGLIALCGAAWRRSPPQAVALIAGFCVSAAVEVVCKATLRHPEPGAVTSIYPYAAHNSYPSGHSLVAAYLAAATLGLLPHRLAGAVALVFVGLVGLSRITTGDHWLSDVLGGTLLGWGMAAMVFSDWRAAWRGARRRFLQRATAMR